MEVGVRQSARPCPARCRWRTRWRSVSANEHSSSILTSTECGQRRRAVDRRVPRPVHGGPRLSQTGRGRRPALAAPGKAPIQLLLDPRRHVDPLTRSPPPSLNHGASMSIPRSRHRASPRPTGRTRRSGRRGGPARRTARLGHAVAIGRRAGVGGARNGLGVQRSVVSDAPTTLCRRGHPQLVAEWLWCQRLRGIEHVFNTMNHDRRTPTRHTVDITTPTGADLPIRPPAPPGHQRPGSPAERLVRDLVLVV